MSHTEDPHSDAYSKTVFGFWLYLLTDFVLFATILATYFVLRNSTFGGPGACALLPLSFTFAQTVLLLVCALTSGLANIAMHQRKVLLSSIWLLVTFVIGCAFLWMECHGLYLLVEQGNGWDRSAFLSAYFTLIGTHAAHIVFGLIWTLLLVGFAAKFGMHPLTLQRSTCLRLFWQFLAMIWVGIFTMVYLLGVS